jgi:hypothetical protein
LLPSPGLVAISALPRLRELGLICCRVVDLGEGANPLAELAAATGLTALNLHGTARMNGLNDCELLRAICALRGLRRLAVDARLLSCESVELLAVLRVRLGTRCDR